jgi:hypothetical protein
MAGSFTTAFPTSLKGELPQGLHRFQGQVTPNATVTINSQQCTLLSSMAGIAPGCSVSGTGIPASSFVADINGTGTFLFGGAGNATATNTGVTLTIAGDVFKCALGTTSPTGTYGAATKNYSNLTGNSDEVPSGGGYTTGGFAWTAAQNITPATSGTGAYWQWSVNPSWTSASFSCSGCIIYNSSSTNRAVYVGSFGGPQTVTSGTLTLIQPTNGVGTSLLQLN